MKFEYVLRQKSSPKYNKPKYKIVTHWEHGDADFTTKSKFTSNDPKEVEEIIEKLFDYYKFIPKYGYLGLGGYKCDREYTPSWVSECDILEYDKTSNYSCYASLEKIELYIDGVEHVIIDVEARKHSPKIILPEVGSMVNTNAGNLPASCSENYICGRNKIPTYIKNKEYTPITGKVVECFIIKQYHQYDTWQVTLYVEEYDAYVAVQYSGVIYENL